MGAAGASRNLALATVAFAVAFVGWSLIAPLAKTLPGRPRPLQHQDAAAHGGAGPARLAACASRPGCSQTVSAARAMFPAVLAPRRRFRPLCSASWTATRPCIVVGLLPRDRRRVVRGRRAVRRRLVPEGAAGLRARRLRDGEHRHRRRGLRRARDRRLARSRGARHRRRGAAARRRRSVFYRMARGPTPRRGAGALRRGAPVGLAALAPRAPLLRHVRRLRRDGRLPAEAAPGLVRPLARPTRACAPPGFTVLATLARPVGGTARPTASERRRCSCVVFVGVAESTPARSRSSRPTPTIVPVTIACLDPRGFLGARQRAPSSRSVPPGLPRRDGGGDRDRRALPAASAASSRRSCMGIVEGQLRDATRCGFVGLARCSRRSASPSPLSTARRRPARGSGRRRALLGGARSSADRREPRRQRMERAGSRTARVGGALPRPLAARQGRALDPRRQLHRLVLVEGPRQGRARHLGDAADRLPVQRPGRARVRAARLPARRLVLLVRLLAAPRPATRTCAARCCELYRDERDAHAATRSTRGRRSSRTRRRRAPTSRSAAWAASCAPPGTRSARSSPPPTSTRSERYGPDRIVGFSPIPAMSMVSYAAGHALPLADRRRLPVLLRLVRRPAAGLAADLGRPDRRARVGRLVELELPDAVGLEHPADAHARRALHDRGALPGPEGRRRLAGLRRPHEVRRPLAARAAGHRRRAGDGDGPRDPQGALRRAPDAVLRRLRQALHRPAVPRHAARARRRLRRRPLPARLRPRRRRGERRVEDRRPGRGDAARRPSPTARSASAGARRARGAGTSSSATSSPRCRCSARTTSSSRSTCRASTSARPRAAASCAAACPPKRIGGHLVTTVFDLLARPARRRAATACRATGRAATTTRCPCTPAWQQEHTGVDAGRVTRIAREFARNAELTEGRSMIVMGAGHQPLVPRRPDLPGDAEPRPALRLPGRQRRRLGALRRPGEGAPDHRLRRVAFATRLDAAAAPAGRRPRSGTWPPTSTATSASASTSSPARWAAARCDGKHFADTIAQSARMGWLPSYPTLTATRSTSATRRRRPGKEPAEHVVDELKSGGLRFAAEDPDDPANFPRILTLWRANLLGSSSKGHEYFLRHLLGVDEAASATPSEPPRSCARRTCVWRDEAPQGKLDLFTTIDFRMNGSALYSDIVLPAATWYEKNDISSTDLHPFVHSFNAGDPAAVGGAHRLGRLQQGRRAVPAAGQEAPRRAPRPRRRAAAARHARGARAARRRRARLEERASASRCPAARCRS